MIDFSTLSSADIFNQTIAPIFQDLDENALRIQTRRQEQDAMLTQESNQTLDLLSQQPQQKQNFDMSLGNEVDYNAPLPLAPVSQGTTQQAAVVPSTQGPTQGTENLKLSNYGYASDSSPDYNSNVLKIGHANNPLKDGVSAALTKSLAKRYGLKTGDMFEITTADGRTMTRRYDDTVPTTYKGKPLPETIDLYELNGSNKFSGKVNSIKKL